MTNHMRAFRVVNDPETGNDGIDGLVDELSERLIAVANSQGLVTSKNSSRSEPPFSRIRS